VAALRPSDRHRPVRSTTGRIDDGAADGPRRRTVSIGHERRP
jgi:hypothetical protein